MWPCTNGVARNCYLGGIVQQVLDNHVMEVIPDDQQHSLALAYAQLCRIDLIKVLRFDFQQIRQDLKRWQ